MNKELLQKAGEALTPIGIYLRSSNISMHPNFHPQHSNSELQVQYKSKPLSECKMQKREGDETNVVSFLFEVGVRLVDETVDDKDNDAVQAEIIAVFVSEYQLKDSCDLGKDAMAEFLNCNVRFHVWPFWREYLQSTCTRMGLPVIPLPHYFRPQETQKS